MHATGKIAILAATIAFVFSSPYVLADSKKSSGSSKESYSQGRTDTKDSKGVGRGFSRQLEQRVVALEAGLVDLNSRFSSMEARVTTMEERVGLAESHISALQSQNAALELQLYSYGTTSPALDARVTELSDEITALTAAMESGIGDVAALRQQVLENSALIQVLMQVKYNLVTIEDVVAQNNTDIEALKLKIQELERIASSSNQIALGQCPAGSELYALNPMYPGGYISCVDSASGGSPGIERLTIMQSMTGVQNKDVRLECPAGWTAVGGGFDAPVGQTVHSSRPLWSNGWRLASVSDPSLTIIAYSTCIRISQ